VTQRLGGIIEKREGAALAVDFRPCLGRREVRGFKLGIFVGKRLVRRAPVALFEGGQRRRLPVRRERADGGAQILGDAVAILSLAAHLRGAARAFRLLGADLSGELFLQRLQARVHRRVALVDLLADLLDLGLHVPAAQLRDAPDRESEHAAREPQHLQFVGEAAARHQIPNVRKKIHRAHPPRQDQWRSSIRRRRGWRGVGRPSSRTFPARIRRYSISRKFAAMDAAFASADV